MPRQKISLGIISPLLQFRFKKKTEPTRGLFLIYAMHYTHNAKKSMRIPLVLQNILTADPVELNNVLFNRPCTNNFIFGTILLPLEGGWKVTLLVDERKLWDMSEGTRANQQVRDMLLPLGLPVDMIFFTLRQRNSGDFPAAYIEALKANECHVYSRRNDDCTWSRIFDVVSNATMPAGLSAGDKLRALRCKGTDYRDARQILLKQLQNAPNDSLYEVRACLSIVCHELRQEKYFNEWEEVVAAV